MLLAITSDPDNHPISAAATEMVRAAAAQRLARGNVIGEEELTSIVLRALSCILMFRNLSLVDCPREVVQAICEGGEHNLAALLAATGLDSAACQKTYGRLAHDAVQTARRL